MTKIFKRITAVALAASMAVLTAVSASAASETKSFAKNIIFLIYGV